MIDIQSIPLCPHYSGLDHSDHNLLTKPELTQAHPCTVEMILVQFAGAYENTCKTFVSTNVKAEL